MKIKPFLSLLLFTAISLMVMALYNGFPFTEGDTGSYIESGIFSMIPKDRSPFYGWFLRYTSLWTSLWFTVFMQCLLLAYLVLKYIQFIQNSIPYFRSRAPVSNSRFTLLTVIAIVSFTCAAWVSAYLMPDIFTAILLLATLLYLSEQRGNIKSLAIYAVIISVAILMHNSHFIILLLFSFLLIIWALIKKQKTILKRSMLLASISGMSWLLMCTINAANGYDFTFSRGSHVFMVTKFSETGILNKYLKETCPVKTLKLCNYQDQIPLYSWDFLWSPESPLYKTGGWDSNKTEYTMIIHDVFTSPRYVKMFVQKSATATIRQLFQVQAPDNVTYQGNWASSAWQRINTLFSDEVNEYTRSGQNTQTISATPCNYIYYLFFILTTIWILFHPQNLGEELKFIYSFIFLFFIINAFVTSTFSTVIYRFQNRVFWILPATNAIIITRYYWDRFQIIPEKNQRKKIRNN